MGSDNWEKTSIWYAFDGELRREELAEVVGSNGNIGSETRQFLEVGRGGVKGEAGFGK